MKVVQFSFSRLHHVSLVATQLSEQIVGNIPTLASTEKQVFWYLDCA